MPRTVASLRRSGIRLERFDGGLNIRDAPSELGSNETPDCMNVTLDERGGAVARLGLSNLNAASLLPGPAEYAYYSTVADALLVYISTDAGVGKLFKSTDAGATWSSAYSAFTAGAKAAIVDFKDRVVVVNTLDGVYSFPSSLGAPTHTAGGSANMEEVRGSAIAVWQNKLWVAGDPRTDATHSAARVWRSNAGNELLWTVATDFTDIRDVDTSICTAIGAGQGMDVTGKPTLLVYKDGSVYRINDSAAGSYSTLHAKGAGAASNKSVASVLGRICSINEQGIWVTDGLGVPVRVSDKLAPLFTQDGLAFSTVANWSAAPYRDRVVFNVTRAGSTVNNLMLEYHPAIGWTVPHTLGLGPMAVYTKNTSRLMAVRAAAGGKVYEVFKGGSDDGAAIAARYQTPWVDVGSGDEARLRYLRVFGRGTPGVQVRTDFANNGDAYALDFTGSSGFLWGTGVWGTGVWGEPAIESFADQALDQVCKHMSLKFSDSTTTTLFRPALLGDGTAPETGAWAVYGAHVDFVNLGT